jgi:uncharacterized Ntn-hydrolase superfamily protein
VKDQYHAIGPDLYLPPAKALQMKRITMTCCAFLAVIGLCAQDTFSIAAVDTLTGEVGSAGASCVNLFTFGISDPGFLAQQLPGVGSINTQASYLAANQNAAMARMQAGDDPDQIVAWLQANDAQGNSGNRQYGIARLDGTGGAQAAAFTGAQCLAVAEHRVGPNYAIQGNILLGPEILDAMEQNFLNTTGTLADKLMAALQGANVVGADTRCAANGTSSLFAFLEVAQPGDPFNQPSLSLGVRLGTVGVEPIDSLQWLYDQWLITAGLPSWEQAAPLHLAPNPVQDRLVLPGATQRWQEFLVFDAQGRRVPLPFVPARSDRVELDVAGLAPGPYHLVLIGDGRRSVGRFVKE